MKTAFKTRMAVLREWPDKLKGQPDPLYSPFDDSATVADYVRAKARKFVYQPQIRKVK